MLFHITHRHSEATCPFHNDDVRNASFGAVLESMTAAGVEVVGAWTDPPGHRMFFVLRAEQPGQLYQGLAPIIDQGTADIRPVTEFAQTIQDIASQ